MWPMVLASLAQGMSSQNAANKSAGDANNAIGANRELLNSISLPAYRDYVAQMMNPEAANYDLIDQDSLLKSAKNESLAKLAGLAEKGMSGEDEAVMDMAKSKSGQMARGEREAILNNARARGVGGGGLEFAMKEMANQGAASRSQDAGLAQAAQSARQRAMYNQIYGNAVTQASDTDFKQKAANSGIINDFNRMNTQNRNTAQQMNVNNANEAFKYNEGLKDKRFQNEMARATGNSNLNNQGAAATIEGNKANSTAFNGMVGAFGNLASTPNQKEKKPAVYSGESWEEYR